MLDKVNVLLKMIIDSNENMLDKMQVNSSYMKGYADGVKLVLKDVMITLEVINQNRG